MIVLTGGTGLLGRATTDAAARGNLHLRVVARDPTRAGAFPQGVEVVRGDVADAVSLDAAFARASTVIHLAGAVPRVDRTDEHLRAVNVDGVRRAAEAAARVGAARFVLGGSAGVYGDGDGADARPHRETDEPRPGNAYERSKLDGERAAAEALHGTAVKLVILRPCGLFGAARAATAQFFADVARKRLWLHGPAEVWLSPAPVEDVADAVLRAALLPGLDAATFNIPGARALTYQAWIDLVGAALRVHPRHWRLPRPIGAALASVGVARCGRSVINRAADGTKARQMLQWTPRPLEDAVRDVAAALQSTATGKPDRADA